MGQHLASKPDKAKKGDSSRNVSRKQSKVEDNTPSIDQDDLPFDQIDADFTQAAEQREVRGRQKSITNLDSVLGKTPMLTNLDKQSKHQSDPVPEMLKDVDQKQLNLFKEGQSKE